MKILQCVHIVNRIEEIESKKAPSNRDLKLKAKEFTAEIAESAEKRLKKIGHFRGIGFAFHRAGRRTWMHTDR